MTGIYTVRYSQMKYAWCVYEIIDNHEMRFVEEHGRNEDVAKDRAVALSVGEASAQSLTPNKRDWE